MKQTVSFNIYFPIEVYEELRRVSYQERVPMSRLVKEAVEKLLITKVSKLLESETL